MYQSDCDNTAAMKKRKSSKMDLTDPSNTESSGRSRRTTPRPASYAQLDGQHSRCGSGSQGGSGSRGG